MINNILLTAASSFALALALTPIAKNLAHRYGILDKPSERKVHKKPIARVGGLAIFFASTIPAIALTCNPSNGFCQLSEGVSLTGLFAGAIVAFAVGLVDDFRRLKPSTKLLIQICAALIAYVSGIRIENVQFPWGPAFSLELLSLPVTVFWFLLVINAINLIDGLDGLASGVTILVAVILGAMGVMNGHFMAAVCLASVAGAFLGFLRYNFNPASIFMGDSGSYFAGYMLATLSTWAPAKTDATLMILTPVILLGVPLMDTIVSPIRRFLKGKRMFQPDRDHIHHRLLQLGFGQREAVLVIYAATVFLGVGSVVLLNPVNPWINGFLLLLLCTFSLFSVIRLGYLGKLTPGTLLAYAQDTACKLGLLRERRGIMTQQHAIDRARTHEELWEQVVVAARLLCMDGAEIRLSGPGLECISGLTTKINGVGLVNANGNGSAGKMHTNGNGRGHTHRNWNGKHAAGNGNGRNIGNGNGHTSDEHYGANGNGKGPANGFLPARNGKGMANGNGNGNGYASHQSLYSWKSGETNGNGGNARLVSLCLPLTIDDRCFGNLILKKYLSDAPASELMLKQVESLRRSVLNKLRELESSVGHRQLAAMNNWRAIGN